jgi:hypothetical protein
MRTTWLLVAAVFLVAGGGVSQAQAPVPADPDSADNDWTALLAEDFEDSFPDSACRLVGDPTWGRDHNKPQEGRWSAYSACGGENGVAPPGPYPGGMQAWMICGPFDLSDATAAELSFYYWTHLGPEQDRLFWGISNDGSRYLGESAARDSDGWRYGMVDLANAYGGFLGQQEVWIGFEFRSDQAASGEGAYVDNIRLQVNRGPRPTSRTFKVHVPLVVE